MIPTVWSAIPLILREKGAIERWSAVHRDTLTKLLATHI